MEDLRISFLEKIADIAKQNKDILDNINLIFSYSNYAIGENCNIVLQFFEEEPVFEISGTDNKKMKCLASVGVYKDPKIVLDRAKRYLAEDYKKFVESFSLYSVEDKDNLRDLLKELKEDLFSKK